MPTKNKRRAAFRRRLTSDPPPPDAETRAKLGKLAPGTSIGLVYTGDPTEVLDWIFTFGSGQHHPVTGEHLMGRFLRVNGTWLSARERVLAAFGTKWSMQYRSEDEAGVAEYDLVELPESEWPKEAGP